jgi:hypothetical protein
MQKLTISYKSEIDAIIAISKKLCRFEERYKRSSEDFFHNYASGRLTDSEDFVEWTNTYQHFIAIREILEKRIVDAA